MKVEAAIATRMTPEQRQALEAVLQRADLSARVRERAEMVKAAALGQSLAASCTWSGRTAETVRSWLGRYLAEGLGALADAPRAGRPVRADAAYRQAPETALETPPRELGLLFDVWTSGRLGAYLEETTGVRRECELAAGADCAAVLSLWSPQASAAASRGRRRSDRL